MRDIAFAVGVVVGEADGFNAIPRECLDLLLSLLLPANEVTGG